MATRIENNSSQSIYQPFYTFTSWCKEETEYLGAPLPTTGKLLDIVLRICFFCSTIFPLIGLVVIFCSKKTPDSRPLSPYQIDDGVLPLPAAFSLTKAVAQPEAGLALGKDSNSRKDIDPTSPEIFPTTSPIHEDHIPNFNCIAFLEHSFIEITHSETDGIWDEHISNGSFYTGESLK